MIGAACLYKVAQKIVCYMLTEAMQRIYARTCMRARSMLRNSSGDRTRFSPLHAVTIRLKRASMSS
eukprot:6182116-Pleurochrysis_carterae.AAC.1